MARLPRLVITPGEPAGIGPDICIQLAQNPVAAHLLFVADPDVVKHRAAALGLPIKIIVCTIGREAPPHQAGHFPVMPVVSTAPVIAGRLDRSNAGYVMQTLDRSIELLIKKQSDALVTAPVHKGIINDAGISFTGHTEWLAERTNTKLPVMMLVSEKLRVALVTTHLPLQQISRAITRLRLESTIRVLHKELIHKFNVKTPRIRVCGLNPHAGEHGHLGREEIDTIKPVISELKREGLKLHGPVPADTAFLPDSLHNTDVILAMYHDQGLPVLKYSGFNNAVNITLGPPVIRTSVDHGIALELAGTGKSNPASLLAAVNMAIEMVNQA